MYSIAEAPLNFDRNAVHSANATFRVDFPVPIGDSATNRGVGKGDKMAGSKDLTNDQYKGLSDANLADDAETTLRDLNLITRSVEGIDNDPCLGDKPLSVANRDGGKTVGAPPSFYHENTAPAIEHMTPAKLTTLQGSFTSPDGEHALQPEEINAAVDRLQTMQSSILLARAEGRVVEKFDEETLHNLNERIQQLTERKEHLQNNPSTGDKLKALHKAGPKGIDGEIAKIDKGIAATQLAVDMTRNEVSLNDQKAQLDQMKTSFQQGQAQIDQVKKDLKQAENTLKAVDTKAVLEQTGLVGSMSQSERDELVKQANEAINVHESLKPQVKQLKEDQAGLKTEIKQGEKAVSMRDRLSPSVGQSAAQLGSGHKV